MAENGQQHPAIVQARATANYYLNQLDRELSKYPVLNSLEQHVQVPKTFLVIGAVILVVLSHFINPLAAPSSDLVAWALPAYLSFKTLEGPLPQDTIQWLTYWVIFGFINFMESIASGILYYLPWYYVLKSVFLLWLQLLNFRGAQLLYPVLNTFGQHAQVSKIFSAIGIVILVILLYFVYPLASPSSDLIAWALPAYLSFKTLEGPLPQDTIQWLIYWVISVFLLCFQLLVATLSALSTSAMPILRAATSVEAPARSASANTASTTIARPDRTLVDESVATESRPVGRLSPPEADFLKGLVSLIYEVMQAQSSIGGQGESVVD